MSEFTCIAITLRLLAAVGAARAWSAVIRRVLASGLVAIGVLCALFSGVFRYVDDHFYDAETFLENNAELATNADIREFLFQGFRTEIIQIADGDAEEEEESTTSIAESLLEDNSDAPDPVTQERIERDQAIEEILLDVFDSDVYEQAFTQALAESRVQIERSANLEPEALLRDNGEVFFNMQALYQSLWPALGTDARTAAITATAPRAEDGIFKVADRDTTINPLWSLLRSGPGWRGLATLGAIASLIGAAVLADRRPSTVIQFGGGMVGVGVVVIVIVFLIRFIVPLLAGGASASPVVATYASTTWPLVTNMIRLIIIGIVLVIGGGIARFIWPDNWVYSSVSDERGVRSVRRRRGEPAPAQAQPQAQPVAAAVPVGYPGGYPQQPYGAYPQQWGQQPYPGQYPPGYAGHYPVGPFGQSAQPNQQQPQHYTSPGQPTVPVMPVEVGQATPPAAPPFDALPGDLPADAAQIVPKVVATTATTLDASTAAADTNDAKSTVVENPTASDQGREAKVVESNDDDWASEKDW